LVGPGLLVAAGHLDRVAGVAQLEEVDAFDHPAAVHVQTRNDALRKHGNGEPNAEGPGTSPMYAMPPGRSTARPGHPLLTDRTDRVQLARRGDGPGDEDVAPDRRQREASGHRVFC